MPEPRGGLGTVRGLRARCEGLRELLAEHPEAVSPDELAEYWPGGKRNRATRGRAAWIYCYSRLAVFFARLESSAEVNDRTRDEAEDAARDALRGAPETIELDAVDRETGRPKHLAIFPKSFHALCAIQDYDTILGQLLGAYQQLKKLRTSDAASLYATHGGELLDRMSYYHRLMVWILSHPEPGLPFEDSVTDPVPPDWTTDLSPRDILFAMRAHHYVNGARMALTMRFVTDGVEAGGEGERWSWKTLLNLAAKEMGLQGRTLAREFTLEGVVTQLAQSRAAEQRQHQRAQRTARDASRATSGIAVMG